MGRLGAEDFLLPPPLLPSASVVAAGVSVAVASVFTASALGVALLSAFFVLLSVWVVGFVAICVYIPIRKN